MCRFIFLPRRSRRASRRCITGEVRFRDHHWPHPGHVSCLIGATPLNCLRCTIARRRLTHCDYASHRCVYLAPATSSRPGFVFPPRVLLFSPIFIFIFSYSLFLPAFLFLRARSSSRSSSVSQFDRMSQGLRFSFHAVARRNRQYLY